MQRRICGMYPRQTQGSQSTEERKVLRYQYLFTLHSSLFTFHFLLSTLRGYLFPLHLEIEYLYLEHEVGISRDYPWIALRSIGKFRWYDNCPLFSPLHIHKSCVQARQKLSHIEFGRFTAVYRTVEFLTIKKVNSVMSLHHRAAYRFCSPCAGFQNDILETVRR